MTIDKNKISLRCANKSDIDLIVEYRITFLKEIQGIPSIEMESHLRKTLKQYLSKSFENDSFVSWIAEYENKSIGFSGMVIREQAGNFEMPDGKTGYILNMFTIKGFQEKRNWFTVVSKTD